MLPSPTLPLAPPPACRRTARTTAVGGLAAVLLCCGAGVRADDCRPGSELEPRLCPLRIPPLKAITIEGWGLKSLAVRDPQVRCDDFRPTKAALRRYIARAKVVDDSDVPYLLDWSPCYAEGQAVFADGRKAAWSVDQFRVGTLAFEDQPAIRLYCPSCKFAPFH